MSSIDTEIRDETAIVTIDRPDQGNRIDTDTAVALIDALEEIRRDRTIGACVLTGRGDAFCLGGSYWSAGAEVEARLEFARSFVDLNRSISRLGKPVIAAVNGDAHAGGFSLVLACDMAFSVASATFGLPEIEKGLFPLLALAVVKDALPKTLLFDIVYNARIMTADEAQSHYLINRVCAEGELLDAAIDTAQRVSRSDRDVVKLGRDLYYGMRCMGPDEALDMSRFALAGALSARDHAAPGWSEALAHADDAKD